jgi:KaiC/GvpD/RAD55 family RecA-like ATPase
VQLEFTHVDGLDAPVLAGGIPKGSVVLFAGAPGTMKSSLAFAALYHNALKGRKGLYISLEQSRESLVQHMKGLGMDPAAAGGNLSILDLGALRAKLEEARGPAWLDLFKMYTQTLKATFPYEFVVLDSLNALEILAKFERHRREIFELFTWLRGHGATAFVISEVPPESEAGGDYRSFANHREDYLSDGILHLKLAKRGDFGVQRQIRVVKMRGKRHSTDYHALVFDHGFRVTRILG